MKKMLKKIILSLFGFASIVVLSNCQVGLGAAVDVQPPVIHVSSPQADAFVRDIFIIEGEYTDDLSVNGVSVVFKNVETEISYKQITATVKPASETDGTKGTWSCSVNPKELGIVDGTYVATVTAMDTYLHTGAATVTFSIDNTAPLIVLTSPSSVELDNPTSFGQIFSVEGKAADDSDVDSIDAIILDENGTELARKTIKNVSTQIQIDVASWSSEDGFYKTIYGDNQEAGTKNYYLGLIAYDGARKVPAVEGDRGNQTSIFYMNNDFAEIDGFKTGVAYNILNGTRSAVEPDPHAEWRKALEEKKIEKATFSLNPINNPYFDVQSYEPMTPPNENGEGGTDLESDTYAFMNKNKLTVNIYVGRDKKAIKTETIGIYLLPCDRKGNLLKDLPKVTLLAPYKDKDGNVIGADNTKQITTVGSTSYKWSSETLDAKNIEGFNIGKYYLFDVVAYDYNGIGIRNDNKYAIKLVSTSAAPIISVSEPGATKSVANSESFVVKGTIKTGAEIVSVKACKNVDTEIVSGPFVPGTNSEVTLNKENSTDEIKIYDFNFTIPAISEDSYSILIYATDTNEQSSSKEIVVTNDKNAPEFDKNPSITPYVDVVEKDDSGNDVKVLKVNGKINIKQLITDDTQVSKVEYSLDEGKTWIENTQAPITTLNISLNTSEYDDENGIGKKLVYLKATDKAGNVAENKSDLKLNIDQSTDAPRINFSNVTIAEEVKLKKDENGNFIAFNEEESKAAKLKASVFGTKSNRSILGTIEDDDGIESVVVLCCKDSVWDNTKESNYTKLLDVSVEGKTTYNLKADLPQEEGTYLIKIIVKDKVKETEYSTTTIEPFLVAVDDGAPVLEITTPTGEYRNGNFKVEGKINDSTATVVRIDYDETSKKWKEEFPKTVEIKDDKLSWEDDINTTEVFNFKYIATDEYNQKSEKEFNFKYDSVAPRFGITEIQGNAISLIADAEKYKDYEQNQKYGNTEAYFSVKGFVKDNWDASELAANRSGLPSYFYYYVSETPLENPNSGFYNIDDKWKTTTITKKVGADATWEVLINFAEEEFYNETKPTNQEIKQFAEGKTLYVYFAAKDVAENVSRIIDNPSAVLKVKIDGTAPSVQTPFVDINDSATTISVPVSDGGSGIEYVVITCNGKTVDTKGSIENGKYVWNIANATLKDMDYFKIGENNFVITVTDNAKNQKAVETIIQNNTPVMEITSTGISLDAPKLITGGKEYSYVKEGFEVEGKVSIAGNLSNVNVKWEDSNGQKGDIELDSNGNFTIPAIIDFKNYHQPITRTITATNVYGSAASQTIKFVYDGYAPRFGITKIQESVTGFDINTSENTDYVTKDDIANYYGTKNKMFDIAGTISDTWCDVQSNKNCCSGAKFYYYLEKTEPSISNGKYVIDDNWHQVSVSKDIWKETLNFEDETKYADKSEWKLYFVAVDNVGNVSEISKNPNAKVTITIDNTSPTVGTPNVDVYNDITKISVDASDDGSGIASVKVTCNGKNAGTATLNETSKKFEWTINNTELITKDYFKKGDNNFEIIVTDNIGNQNSVEKVIYNNTPVINITSTGIPENAPKFIKDRKEYSYIKESFEVSGTVSIEGILKDVKYKDSNKQNATDVTLNNGKFTIPAITDFTDYHQPITRTITATSVYGLSASQEINFVYDNVAPRFGITKVLDETVNWAMNNSDATYSVTTAKQKYGTKNKKFEITGNVSDGWNQAQIADCQSGAKFYYYIGTTEPSISNGKYVIDDNWHQISVASNGSWEVSISFDESKYPNKTDLKLYFAAIDNVGNVSEIDKNPSALINIRIDNNGPQISSFKKDNALELSVAATDSESGISSYKLHRNNEELSGVTLVDGKYTITDYVKAGENKFKVVVIDNAGNESSSGEITITNTNPSLTVTTSADNNYKTSDGYLYSNSDIDVTINVSDTNGLASLVCDSNNSVGLEQLTEKISRPNKDSTSGITRKYIATNVYGLTTEKEIKYIFDITPPQLNTQTYKDTNGNDKPYSTIGGENLGSETLPWFKSADLQLNGRFTEESSGISEIKYKLLNDNSNVVSEGTIPSSKQTGGYETFKSTISGFAESILGKSNILKIWAVDNAGNESSPRIFAINVDTTAPSVSDVKFAQGSETQKDASNVILSNKTKTITVTGVCSDVSVIAENGSSGIDTVSLKLGTVEKNATISKNDGTWSIEIPTTDLENLSGSITLPITVKDKAGNIASGNSLSLKIDTAEPTTEVGSPKTEMSLNGKISFNGTVKEENIPESIQLYYYFSTETTPTVPTDLSGWKTNDNLLISKSKGADDTEIKNWKFEDFNVNGLLGENEENGALFILPVAYDQAGNCSVDTTSITKAICKQYTVDLNSDRPVITFQNLPSASGAILKYTSQLTGTITDDDGVKILKIANQSEKPTDWSNVAVVPNPTSFNYNLGVDGSKTLWFYVEDTAGGIFISSNTKTVNQPYVSYKTEDGYSNPENNNSAISFITDSTAPVMESILFISCGEGESIASPSAIMPDSVVVGGTKKRYVRFGIKATDTNGIKSVSLTGIADVIFTKDTQDSDYWYSNVIDLQDAKYTEGLKTLTFETVDNADISATPAQKRVTIDKSAPSVEIISPLETDEVTGSVTITGTTSDEYSNIGIVKYLVLNNTYVTESSNQLPDVDASKFVKEVASSRSWKVALTDLPDSEAEVSSYSNITHTGQDIYTLPIYFYMEDELGNCSVSKEYSLTYNPYGDRPQTEVTYPTGTRDEVANVNGAIRVTGSASDNVSVKEVYIQLDVNKDGNFNNDDITILDACLDAGTTGNKVYTIVKSATDYKTGDAVNADMSAISDNFWGIKVNGTNSWNYTINKFAELLTGSNKISEGKYSVNIRSIAVDNNYKFGKWSDIQYVEFDTNIPSIGKRNKNVKEYDSNGTTVKATKAYITDMYLKGKAELELSVEDKNGIKQVMYYIANTEEGLASATGTIITNLGQEKTWTDDAGNSTKGYIVSIPLSADSTASGAKYVKVVATKKSDTETTAYEKFSVNFDNSIPRLNHISLNGVRYADSDKKVVNSNGNYFTFASSVTDEGGSGFDKLVFYYYRTGKNGSANRIYNPLIDSLDSDGKTNNNSRMNVAGTDSDSMTIAGKTIYGSKQTATIATDKRTITLSQTASSQIRGGGLVNIAGSWITIERVSGTTVELKSDSSVTGSQSVFFAYAQVIDNTGSEKTNANGNLLEGEASGDDGDGMAESILKYLTTWTCDATFRSRNIPDGPGKFVVFAFDKAGNVVSSEYDASVQNNAPRLTRVMLATDLNGDGEYQYYSESSTGPVNDNSKEKTANGTEYGEFAYYSTLNAEGNASNEVDVKLPTGRDPFIVKNNLLVVPEFVGGNGKLSYTYKIADSLETATITQIAEDGNTLDFTKAENSKIVKQDESKGDFKDSKTTTIFNGEQVTGISYEFEILDGTGNEEHLLKKHESWTQSEIKGTRYLAATFWDSTEETTPGVDSCYALLKMPLIINVIDDNKPTANIIPFYWNSKEDSSFVYDDDENPLGHIDIPTGTEKPGVSGEVYIEGYAWDDTRLGGIWMTTPGANETYQVAKYEGGNWSKVTTDWPTNWKDFEILEDFGIRQSGHTVKWRFRIDMTPYGLDEGKSVIVKAIDAQTNEMDSFTEENTINNITKAPTYIMDFVPYIKSIYSEDIGSATRSRLGKFPVRAGANMIIEGMNFASGATYKVKFYKSNKLVNGKIPENTEADSTVTATFVSDGKIRVTAPDYSRWVEVEVTPTGKTAVSTKNNGNDNGGYNIEAGYVAKANDKGLSQANTAGTNFWTDDRYISVWNNTALTGSINPWDGTVKQIRSRDTRDGSFYKNTSGNDVTSQSNTTDTYYAGWSSPNMMIYSTMGNGAATNIRTLYNNSQASFVTPVETVDIAIIGGLPWYVINDNYVGGDSANTWGAGLMVAREGYDFPKKALNGTNTISNSENLNIVERQGSAKSADSRDSSNGYDSVLHQFKNPKITGWYDGISVSMNNGNGNTTYPGTVYVYVSYYDSYARCLKYAAFTEGWSNGGVGEKWGNINGTKNFKTLARAANDHKNPTTVVAGVDRTYNNPTDFSVTNGEDCGEWSDIMVDPTSHVPVIIYYNKTKGTLEIAQGKSNAPSTANYKASATAFTDTTEGDDGWNKTKAITPKNGIDFGRYVSAEIDSQGNIHASAMDVTNGKLYYIFLDKDENGTSYTPTYQIVDSTSAVGMWTDIQLGKYEADTSIWNDYEPIISYLDKSNLNTTKAVKVAYVSDGTWESISDPAVYEAYDKKTNSMCNVYETTTTGTKAKIGVSFNSSMLAVDFLRGEE